jgi:hypothetical protein
MINMTLKWHHINICNKIAAFFCYLMSFLARLIVIAPKCAIELGFMMKTIPTHNNELVMETLCLENHDNLKNISRFPRGKDVSLGMEKEMGLRKRCSLGRRWAWGGYGARERMWPKEKMCPHVEDMDVERMWLAGEDGGWFQGRSGAREKMGLGG